MRRQLSFRRVAGVCDVPADKRGRLPTSRCAAGSHFESVTLNVTMITEREGAECLASLSTMIGLPRARELVHSLQMYCKLLTRSSFPHLSAVYMMLPDYYKTESHSLLIETANSKYPRFGTNAA
ncbi:hypothetical protein EVAR_56256_1 [Eumeta japonica]|uniref:Uncharacterized protein n=1 Tax=Eumeta variegata TaxID=151549 RepID=A0A4C1XH38_EUMVA|nr:hypothetical protein EVAR_56256_1 [Eumeta japonica]